jgi:hypothetical protein
VFGIPVSEVIDRVNESFQRSKGLHTCKLRLKVRLEGVLGECGGVWCGKRPRKIRMSPTRKAVLG